MDQAFVKYATCWRQRSQNIWLIIHNAIIVDEHEILDNCHTAVVFSLRYAHPDTLHDGLLSGEPLSGNPYPLREHSTDRRRRFLDGVIEAGRLHCYLF